jgi:putative PIN family toxin of toxin-antitoxin system
MARPSVVLDTNVVVSAHLNTNGLESFVLDLVLAGTVSFSVSDEILEEYGAVLGRAKFGIFSDLLAMSMELIRESATLVRPKHRVTVASDPDDNKFLECAEEAKADYLITGNKRHFPKTWGTTRVVSTRELLEAIIPTLKH